MAGSVGYVSGPLLKDNLIRNGVDLSFSNRITDSIPILKLDVNNNRIGVNKLTPLYDLDISGTTRTDNIIVNTRAEIGNIIIENDVISSSTSILNLGTLDQVVYQNLARIDNIELTENTISTNDTDVNLEIRPNGTGSVEVFSDLNVTGNIHATGNIRTDGNIVIGDEITDTVVVNARVASDIIPEVDVTYTLGTEDNRWQDVYTDRIVATTVESGDIVLDGIDLTLTEGNTWYVTLGGNDTTYTGQHPLNPYRTITKALSEAQTGDTVYIAPGEYEEVFPLTVPTGVTVRGQGLRAVAIVPTSATNTNDAFLLNGETTIQDLTVKDFFSPGYAFKFASGFTVSSRSPYINNVSVITKGSVTSAGDPLGFDEGDAGKGALIDGSVATSTSKEASLLFHSVTFITPGVDCIVTTNGARIEWLNSFTYFANRSIYAYDGTAGLKGAGRTALRVDNLVGTITAGETVTYYDTDGVSVIATDTIESVDADNKFYVSGKNTNFETVSERGGKLISANGNAQLSTSVKKFGTAALALDGTGDYASLTASNDFGFGTSDFTFEGWFYFNSVAATQNLFDFRAGAGSNVAPVVYINAGGELRYYSYSADRITGATLTTSQWYHIAVSRTGNTTELWLGGVSQGTWTVTATDYGTAKPLTIGARWDGANGVNGLVDDVRVIKGTSVYTASFTPPNTRLTVTPDTVLMARFDGENASTVFADDVQYAQDIRFSGGATAEYITLTDFTDFGAEIRLIGSASVYGNYGLVGDGPGVIMYAIGHNFAYIGNGKSSTNDALTVIQSNEVVETNSAKIRYNSVDHNGDFRVGNLFYVDQETGTVDFAVSEFNILTENGLTFNTDGNITYIDGEKIETGNLRISGNTVESLSGDINLQAASDEINLQNNVNIDGDLDVTGNVTIGGNITLGDEATDTINIVAGIDSDIIPDTNDTYSLGTDSLRWSNLFVDKVITDDIEIKDNYIQTTAVNSDLELRANGTGEITVPDNDVVITNDLTVNGITTLGNTDITGTVTIVGDVDHTGNYGISEDLVVEQNLEVFESAIFSDILISDNIITTTADDNDLDLRAAGTGRIIIPTNDVIMLNNLAVQNNISVTDVTSTTVVNTPQLYTGDLLLEDNVITTTEDNSDLELRANGFGVISIPDNNVEIDQQLTVSSSTSLVDTTITGTLTHVGNTEQTGNFTLTGKLTVSGLVTINSDTQFENINISDNVITTTDTNSNLELRANGSGVIYIPNSDVEITQDLTVAGQISTNNIVNAQNISADNFTTSDITISDNTISTTDNDLEILATGTGSILINQFSITDSTISSSADMILQPGSEYLKIDSTGALLLPSGTTAERPTAEAGQIRFNSDLNRFEGYNGTNWINLAGVEDVDGNSKITAELTEGANDNIIRFYVDGVQVVDINETRLNAPRVTVDDIQIDGNVINTVTSDTDLVLDANGTGRVIFDNFAFKDNVITNTVADSITLFENTNNGYVKFAGTSGMVIPTGTSAERPPFANSETGMLRYNTEDARTEIWNGTEWVSVAGSASGIIRSEAEDIAIQTILILG